MFGASTTDLYVSVNKQKNLRYSYERFYFSYQECGCVNPALWDRRTIILPGSDTVIQAPLCDVTDPCIRTAVIKFMNVSFESQNLDFDCPQECKLIDFDIKKSSLATPLEWQILSIKRFVERTNVTRPPDWSTAWRAHIHANYLAITVSRETYVVESITQKATISPVDVLSNIGGQTGLWIGISLLSIMELIEMLYRLIRHQCHVLRVTIQNK